MHASIILGCFKNGAPVFQHGIPEAPDFQKWTLTQGTQTGPKTNQTSTQTNPKFEPKLHPTWHRPGTKFGFTNKAKCLEKINVSARLTQKKGGGGVSP